jgi:hypothetical protein
MSYQPKVYRRQGGNQLIVDQANGGRLTARMGLTTLATVGNETYTAAQIAGGVIARDPAGGARTDTTDTAAALISGLDLETDGDTHVCYLINTADAAEAITLAGGDSVTIANVAQTLAQNESALLLFRRTSATAVTLYILGA